MKHNFLEQAKNNLKHNQPSLMVNGGNTPTSYWFDNGDNIM